MTDQPEKAGHIQATTRLLALSASDMAAEIERLREDQSLLREIVVERQEEIDRLRAQRDQLLAALSWIEDQDPQVVDAAREKFNLAER